jgi:hypothetical protein
MSDPWVRSGVRAGAPLLEVPTLFSRADLHGCSALLADPTLLARRQGDHEWGSHDARYQPNDAREEREPADDGNAPGPSAQNTGMYARTLADVPGLEK